VKRPSILYHVRTRWNLNICRYVSLPSLVILFAATAFARPGVIARASNPVPSEYIVVFQPIVPSVAARAAVTTHQGSVIMEFS